MNNQSLFSKANLVVSQVASTDPFDRGLNGVKFDRDGSTVAGNTKMMLGVGPTDESRVHFPEVGERVEIPDDGLIMGVDVVNEALKNLPRDKRVSLQHVAMTQPRDYSKVEFTCVSASGRERRVADRPKREAYPDWKAVVRKVRGENPIKVCVNRKDLIELLKAIEAACPDKGGDNPVYMEIGSGIVLRSVNRDTGQHAVGAINAYRTGGHWLEWDEWEKTVFQGGAQKHVKRKVKRLRKS